jgi:hypothetical protein
MLRDFTENISAMDQRASATAEVIDWVAGDLAAAAGDITIDNYALMNEAQAAGTITYGVPVAGDTVVVNGETFTCVESGRVPENSALLLNWKHSSRLLQALTLLKMARILPSPLLLLVLLGMQSLLLWVLKMLEQCRFLETLFLGGS